MTIPFAAALLQYGIFCYIVYIYMAIGNRNMMLETLFIFQPIGSGSARLFYTYAIYKVFFAINY